MARSSIWAAFAVALLAFAPVASAAEWTVTVQGQRTYASESITSGDAVIHFRGEVLPAVVARLTLEDSEVDLIDRNDTVDLTFTLVNAKFAQAVRGSALTLSVSGITECDVRVRSVDSEAGSASVTFTIETVPLLSIDTGDCAVIGMGTRRGSFSLEMQSLTGLDNTKPVQAKLTVDAPAGSGWPTANAGSAGDGITATRNPVVYDKELLLSVLLVSTVAGSEIDLAAHRTGLICRSSPPSCPEPPPSAGQAHLAIVRVGRDGAAFCTARVPPYGTTCRRQRDGRPFSLGRGGDGRGDLNVTVTGDFRDGDVVFLDLDDDRKPGAGEELDLQADGSMQESFRLDYVAGNPNAADGERGEADREEGVATKNLYYRPNGTDALRPGEYRSVFTVTTDSSEVADILDRVHGVTGETVLHANTHTTSYTLTEDMQIAYAIPPQRAGDSGTVRVNCKGSTPCALYLECDDPDGMSYFKQVEEPVPGRSTLVLTAEDLSDALDLGEGVWESGRMSCTIHSTRDISVQQLTRSAAGVLVNNTYVDN